MDFPFWTIVSTPLQPRIHASIENHSWKLNTTTGCDSRLSVLAQSLVTLTCFASFPVKWIDQKSQAIKDNSTLWLLDDQNPHHHDFDSTKNEASRFQHDGYQFIKETDQDRIEANGQYKATFTIKNFTEDLSGSYICQTPKLPHFRTKIDLRLRENPVKNDSHSLQFIQTGFDTIRKPPATTFPSRVLAGVVASFIYKAPSNSTLHVIRKVKLYSYPPEISVDLADPDLFINYRVKASTVSVDNLTQTTLYFHRGSPLLQGEEFHFMVKARLEDGNTVNITVAIKIEHLYLYKEKQPNQIPESESRDQNADFFVHGSYYELHLYWPSSKGPAGAFLYASMLIPQEQDVVKCASKNLRLQEAITSCGLHGFSAVENDPAFEQPGNEFVVYLQPSHICSLRAEVKMELGKGKWSLAHLSAPSFLVAISYQEIFGDHAFKQPKISTGLNGIEEKFVYVNNSDKSLKLRCQVPSCYWTKSLVWCMPGGKCSKWVDRPHHPSSPANDIKAVEFHSTLMWPIASNLDVAFDLMPKQHAGNYECRMNLSKEPLKTLVSTIEMRVGDPEKPAYAIMKIKRPLLRDHGLNVSCKPTSGYPPPTVTWDWTPFATKPTVRVVDPDIPILEVHEFGFLTCFAKNNLGDATMEYQFEHIPNDKEGLTRTRILTTPMPLSSILMAVIIPTVFVLLAIALVIIRWRMERAVNASFKEIAQLLRAPLQIEAINYQIPLNDQIAFLPYNRGKYEISRDSFKIQEKLLGTGQFGKIYKGVYRPNGPAARPVAIKMPRDCKNVTAFRAMGDELTLMSQIRPHINVVTLVGACTGQVEYRQLFILTEFCENGSLKDYLIKYYFDMLGTEYDRTRNQYVGVPGTVEKLLNYAYQTATGMEYLSAQKIIHRDLALRNLLLTGTNIVKIADFGLSYRYNSLFTKKKLSSDDALPLAWMSLESLDGTHSRKSDIWSFGVVVWEMFCFGKRIPYEEHGWLTSDIQEFCGWLSESENNRLKKPTLACDEMYEMMLTCWIADPDLRPTFSECKGIIARVLEHRSPAMYGALLVALSEAWLSTAPMQDSGISEDGHAMNLALDGHAINGLPSQEFVDLPSSDEASQNSTDDEEPSENHRLLKLDDTDEDGDDHISAKPPKDYSLPSSREILNVVTDSTEV